MQLKDGFINVKKRESKIYNRTYGKRRVENGIKTERPKFISESDNVYNADETGLFDGALPEHTYLFKNENAKGSEISKECITLLFCANMSGKKQNLLAIEKGECSRCFKSVKCITS